MKSKADRFFNYWVIYNSVLLVILPQLSIGRGLGLIQPAYILYVLNPLLVLLLLINFNKKIFVINKINIAIVIVFLLSLFQGMNNYFFEEGNYKYFFSHLFQIFACFVMFNSGRQVGTKWNVLGLDKVLMLGFYSVVISTLIAAFFLQSGSLGRYYSPAYSLLLPSAYFIAIKSKKHIYSTFIVSLLSNKRAVIGAILSMLVIGMTARKRPAVIRPAGGISGLILKKVLLSVLLIIAFVFIANQQGDKAYEKVIGGVGSAYRITMNRIENTLLGFEEGGARDVSKDRTREIDSALYSLNTQSDHIFGMGAGWNITTVHGIFISTVQNIHFSPISIYVVFGVLGVFVFYGMILGALFKLYRRRDAVGVLCFTFILGALLHSFASYSLFVDLNLFLLVGMAYGKK